MILGDVDANLQMLEVAELCHSRWLILACTIPRFYVSVSDPSESLQTMAQFCIKVYFPSWFDIKRNATISDGSVHYFNMITRIATFPQKTVRSIGVDTLQRNSFFAHPENALLSMLSDTNSDVRNAVVSRIQCLRAVMEPANQPNINVQKSQDKSYSSDTIATPNIRKFLLQVNFQARSYCKMTNINTPNMTEPPLLRLFSDQEIEDITKTLSSLPQPSR